MNPAGSKLVLRPEAPPETRSAARARKYSRPAESAKCSGAPSIVPLSFAMGGIVKILLAAFAFLQIATTAHAQFEIEESHTTASLRGIANVGGGVAWASGTNGTVLRTLDDGKTWQTCPVPLAGTKDTAEKLDFRGIQAFDAHTAIVMSSGPGDQSRLYKTTDGCQTWKLLFTNPDKDGFWDAIKFSDRNFGVLLGDPVSRKIHARMTSDGGLNWRPFAKDAALSTGKLRGGIFAASNSSLLLPSNPNVLFGIANVGSTAHIFEAVFGQVCPDKSPSVPMPQHCPKDYHWEAGADIPIRAEGEASGVFSIAATQGWTDDSALFVAVGGDYLKPEQPGSAAWARELHWLPAQTPPHGYRSAVAYEEKTKSWITVGPNGTDISTDDGRNWRPLTPTPQDAPDADKNWNALSLPFVVGPKGRIGKLRPTALPTRGNSSAQK